MDIATEQYRTFLSAMKNRALSFDSPVPDYYYQNFAKISFESGIKSNGKIIRIPRTVFFF